MIQSTPLCMQFSGSFMPSLTKQNTILYNNSPYRGVRAGCAKALMG
jgi:hypothetical protein